MRVKLENGEFVDDGYIQIFGFGMYNNYIGQDSGFRSRDMETEVHKQATLSRLDEKHFDQIVYDKDYYEVYEGVRYYNLCLRCGYVPNSKVEQYENTIQRYYDAHCKCGNAMALCDWSPEQLDKYFQDLRDYEYQKMLFKDLYEE